jgi:hypothetical protein
MGENKHTDFPSGSCKQQFAKAYWIEIIAQFAKASASGLYATCLGQIVVKKVKNPLALS